MTRVNAVNILKNYIGQDLYEIGQSYGITMYTVEGKQNKGWKGLVLESILDIKQNSLRAPNGFDFELKSVAYQCTLKGLQPKETMAITMVNPADVIVQSFFDSHCYKKLKSLLLCAVEWNGPNSKKATLLAVSSFDFLKDDEILYDVEEDYNLLKSILIENGLSGLSGKYGKWIQARTKGPGHGSTSRAFYARKNLVRKVFGNI